MKPDTTAEITKEISPRKTKHRGDRRISSTSKPSEHEFDHSKSWLLKDTEIRDEEDTLEDSRETADEDLRDDISDLEVAKKMIKISQSAYDRKLEFNLSFETVKRLLRYRRCYYTGKLFGKDGEDTGRSFDRVDSSKGYVEGNVVACTIDINQKKSNLSLDEIRCLYEKLCADKEQQ